MVNYREVLLFVNSEVVKQLCVVGLAAERFWHEAFHQWRGLSSLRWSDVTSVNLLDVVRKDDAGRSRKHGRLQVDLTPADSQLALRVAKAKAKAKAKGKAMKRRRRKTGTVNMTINRYVDLVDTQFQTWRKNCFQDN